MSANDKQVGGTHYSTDGGLQHWDIVNVFKLDYFQGQITKYVMRWNKKNGVEDLKKAAHFLEKYIELQSTSVDERKYTRITDQIQYSTVWGTRLPNEDIGPIDSDAKFTAEGWFGDGVVHYVCRDCRAVVHAAGLSRAHLVHSCQSSKAST